MPTVPVGEPVRPPHAARDAYVISFDGAPAEAPPRLASCVSVSGSGNSIHAGAVDAAALRFAALAHAVPAVRQGELQTLDRIDAWAAAAAKEAPSAAAFDAYLDMHTRTLLGQAAAEDQAGFWCGAARPIGVAAFVLDVAMAAFPRHSGALRPLRATLLTEVLHGRLDMDDAVAVVCGKAGCDDPSPWQGPYPPGVRHRMLAAQRRRSAPAPRVVERAPRTPPLPSITPYGGMALAATPPPPPSSESAGSSSSSDSPLAACPVRKVGLRAEPRATNFRGASTSPPTSAATACPSSAVAAAMWGERCAGTPPAAPGRPPSVSDLATEAEADSYYSSPERCAVLAAAPVRVAPPQHASFGARMAPAAARLRPPGRAAVGGVPTTPAVPPVPTTEHLVVPVAAQQGPPGGAAVPEALTRFWLDAFHETYALAHRQANVARFAAHVHAPGGDAAQRLGATLRLLSEQVGVAGDAWAAPHPPHADRPPPAVRRRVVCEFYRRHDPAAGAQAAVMQDLAGGGAPMAAIMAQLAAAYGVDPRDWVGDYPPYFKGLWGQQQQQQHKPVQRPSVQRPLVLLDCDGNPVPLSVQFNSGRSTAGLPTPPGVPPPPPPPPPPAAAAYDIDDTLSFDSFDSPPPPQQRRSVRERRMELL